jgi:hypothetical protein
VRAAARAQEQGAVNDAICAVSDRVPVRELVRDYSVRIQQESRSHLERYRDRACSIMHWCCSEIGIPSVIDLTKRGDNVCSPRHIGTDGRSNATPSIPRALARDDDDEPVSSVEDTGTGEHEEGEAEVQAGGEEGAAWAQALEAGQTLGIVEYLEALMDLGLVPAPVSVDSAVQAFEDLRSDAAGAAVDLEQFQLLLLILSSGSYDRDAAAVLLQAERDQERAQERADAAAASALLHAERNREQEQEQEDAAAASALQLADRMEQDEALEQQRLEAAADAALAHQLAEQELRQAAAGQEATLDRHVMPHVHVVPDMHVIQDIHVLQTLQPFGREEGGEREEREGRERREGRDRREGKEGRERKEGREGIERRKGRVSDARKEQEVAFWQAQFGDRYQHIKERNAKIAGKRADKAAGRELAWGGDGAHGDCRGRHDQDARLDGDTDGSQPRQRGGRGVGMVARSDGRRGTGAHQHRQHRDGGVTAASLTLATAQSSLVAALTVFMLALL